MQYAGNKKQAPYSGIHLCWFKGLWAMYLNHVCMQIMYLYHACVFQHTFTDLHCMAKLISSDRR